MLSMAHKHKTLQKNPHKRYQKTPQQWKEGPTSPHFAAFRQKLKTRHWGANFVWRTQTSAAPADGSRGVRMVFECCLGSFVIFCGCMVFVVGFCGWFELFVILLFFDVFFFFAFAALSTGPCAWYQKARGA